MKNVGLINVIDIEATCWDKEHQKKSNTSEIIEIGIAVVDCLDLEIVERDTMLIQPTESSISEFCTRLTTIDDKLLAKEGASFTDALFRLGTEFDAENRPWVSWGDYDRTMFQRQCKRRQAKYPFGSRHINYKTMWAILHASPKELGLGAALQHTHLSFTGTQHRGEDDAWNIAKLLLTDIAKQRN